MRVYDYKYPAPTGTIDLLGSKRAYWGLSGNGFTLAPSTSECPEEVFACNNPVRSSIVRPILFPHTSKVMEFIKMQETSHCGFILDEFTIVKTEAVVNFGFRCNFRSHSASNLFGAQSESQYVKIYRKMGQECLLQYSHNTSCVAVMAQTPGWMVKICRKKGISGDHKSNGILNTQPSLEPIILYNELVLQDQGRLPADVAVDRGSSARGLCFWKLIRKQLKMWHELPNNSIRTLSPC